MRKDIEKRVMIRRRMENVAAAESDQTQTHNIAQGNQAVPGHSHHWTLHQSNNAAISRKIDFMRTENRPTFTGSCRKKVSTSRSNKWVESFWEIRTVELQRSSIKNESSTFSNKNVQGLNGHDQKMQRGTYVFYGFRFNETNDWSLLWWHLADTTDCFVCTAVSFGWLSCIPHDLDAHSARAAFTWRQKALFQIPLNSRLVSPRLHI